MHMYVHERARAKAVQFELESVLLVRPAWEKRGSSMSANHEQTVPLEQMSTVELTMWLQSKGFGANVQSAFEGNY